jgi:hypothetical protein
MRDIKSPTWIKIKAALFLTLGVSVFGLTLADHPTFKFAFLLVVTVWSFCRFYYFIFYVLERYVDPSYRFSGLLSFLRYLLSKRS